MKLNLILTKLLVLSVFFTIPKINTILKPSSHSKNVALTHLGLVKITIADSDNIFETDIYFNTNASSGLDLGYDASLIGGVAPPFSIYSLLVEQNTGTPMGIQSLGENDLSNVIVPLGINTTQLQQIDISISEMTIPEYINVYLEDKKTSTFTLLNDNNYSFMPDSNMGNGERFLLHFQSEVLGTEKVTLKNLDITFDAIANRIIIKGYLNSETKYQIYDIGGDLILGNILNDKNLGYAINTSSLNYGVYILKLQNANSEYTQKLLVF